MPYLTEHRSLLDGYRAGDAASLREVYLHYAPGLMEFLRHGFAFDSRGKRCFFKGYQASFDLENAMQEVFLRVFAATARERYDGLRPFVNYIFGIGRNFIIDEYRRRRAAVELFAEIDDVQTKAIDSDSANASFDPEVHSEEKEIGSLLSEFLADSDEKTQAYYKFRYGQHLTQNEVAQEMQLTRIQIRRIESRFRKELLLHFKNSGYLRSTAQIGGQWAGASLVLLLLML